MFKEIFYGLVIVTLVVMVIFGGFALLGAGKVTPLGNATATPSLIVTVTEIKTGGNMAVEKGDNVSVWYVGSLEDGSVFDTNVVDEAKKAGTYQAARPYTTLDFTVGSGQLIKGFDSGVIGMKQGETKTLTLKPADAYGERSNEMIQQFPLSDLIEAGITDPKVGMQLQTAFGATGNITAIKDNNATIDFNHFLAGKTLIFKITVDKIQKAK